MRKISYEDVYKKLSELNAKRPYRAMYSSLYGGVVTDPAAMIVPVDDHMVHRGDGVFEAIRFTARQCYLLQPHVERLARSAQAISMTMPETIEKIAEHCEALREMSGLSGLSEGMLRLFISRGPGDFSPNPYSTLGSQLYIVVTDFKPMPAEKYNQGATVRLSRMGVKPAPFAQIKSCNYLPNVLMKKESVDLGCDFVLGVNDDGHIAEGPTENVMIVSAKGDLVAPRFDYTLKGTTLLRAMEFAKAKECGVRAAIFDDLQVADFTNAKEIMMVGTTLGVLPVTEFQGQPVADGKPGAVARYLRARIEADIFGECL